MKKYKKHLLVLLASVLLISCDIIDAINDGLFDGGIYFTVVNRTNEEIEHAKFYIGKYNNNIFTATDSLIENTKIKANSSTPFGNGLNGRGWEVNLNKIKPEKGIFLIKLSNGKEYFFGNFSFPRPPLEGAGFNIYIEDGRIYWPG